MKNPVIESIMGFFYVWYFCWFLSAGFCALVLGRYVVTLMEYIDHQQVSAMHHTLI